MSAEKCEALIVNEEDIRIVLVGKTGAGKSATGNTILGFKAFESELFTESVTKCCKKVRGEVTGTKVSVIDTPGLFDTKFTKEETLEEIKKCMCLAAPGPHVFLIVIRLGRFTEEEQKSVELIQEVFGQMSNEYTMILFTYGDQIEAKPVENIVKMCPKLQGFITKCGGRYHVFNNKTQDPSQVTKILEKVNNMVLEKGGFHYTNGMFQYAEKQIEEKKQQIIKKNLKKRGKDEEKLKKAHEREALKKTETIMKERQEQEARYASEMEERKRKEMEKLKKHFENEREALIEQFEQEERSHRENEEKKHKEEDELKKKEEAEALEKEMKELNERFNQEAREKAERSNKFVAFGLVSAVVGACSGAYAGASAGLLFGPVGIVTGGIFGGVLGGILGGVAGVGTAWNPQAAEAGAQAVASVGKAVKEHCTTQ